MKLGWVLPLIRPFGRTLPPLRACDGAFPPTAAVDSVESLAICEADKQCLELFWEAISGVFREARIAFDLEADVSRWQSVEVGDGRVIGLNVLFPSDLVPVELEGEGSTEARSLGTRHLKDICVDQTLGYLSAVSK